jgi:hypothetical protein
MPAIEHGLGLGDRVVRRHVAKMETVGWCERRPAIRGDGMLVWLTPSGLDGVGLSELPALRAPGPFSPQTQRSIRVAWVAADIERAGYQWIASREMALAPSPWGVQVANERGGHSCRLPDLAFWPARDGGLQVAVVVVQGQSNPRRERAALEGWQASILAGRYAQVRYLAGHAAGGHLRRLAASPVNASWPTSLPYCGRLLRTSTRHRCPSSQWPLPISRDLHRRMLSHSVQDPRSSQRRPSRLLNAGFDELLVADGIGRYAGWRRAAPLRFASEWCR